MKKDFLTLLQRTPEELKNLIRLGLKLKEKRKKGESHRYLEGKSLAMIFEKASTRTRISFEVGMSELGGTPLFLSRDDIQLGRGETVRDTARVMSRYVHGIMIRTFGQERVEELAKFASVPVINGLSDLYHPCQIMADIMTVYEIFGGCEGIKVAYVGDGNNMVHSWMNGCARLGMDLSVATPRGYEPEREIYERAREIARNGGREIKLTEDPFEAVENAQVVYTDVWTSMGMEEQASARLKAFEGFSVTSELMNAAAKNAVFMHCLPAHRGEEVTEEVFESERSVVFEEAENRLHIQKAILTDCLGEK